MNMKFRIAAVAASGLLAIAPTTALAGGKGGKPCSKKAKACATTGRMTGGGSIFGTNAFRTTHGFQIRCDAPDKSNLEVNWGGDRFHATSFSNLVCDGPPTTKPDANFSRLTGQAAGRYDGQPATAWFQFTDNGEPGTSDTASILVFDADGNVVLDVSGTLQNGNQQAHNS